MSGSRRRARWCGWMRGPERSASASRSAGRRGGSRSTATASGSAPAQALVAGGLVYVASRNDQAVTVLDPQDGHQIGDSIRVGLNPVAMVADDRSVWVIALDDTLTRIDYRG